VLIVHTADDSCKVKQAGALVAGVVFGLVSDRTKFVISAVCGAVGMAITVLLVPDISGLDLSEGLPRSSSRCLPGVAPLQHGVNQGLSKSIISVLNSAHSGCKMLMTI
jgi:hypothetical protein